MINPLLRRLAGATLTVGVMSGLLLGCSSSDTTGIPTFETADPYARLQLNVRAAVMSTVAPYDTLQLMPTAYDINGNVIPLPGPVTYTVNDTTLKVSASGLLTVTNKPSASAMVVASVQDTTFRLTHSDTAFIAGTTTVPASPLASFSIQPASTDSAVLDIASGTKTLTVTALDAMGHVIPATALSIHFASRNDNVAPINAQTGTVVSNSPGFAYLTATTTYYGVTKTDSLKFRIGYPDTVTLVQQATVLPNGMYRYSWNWSNLVIEVGKTVIFKIPDFVFNTTTDLIGAGDNLPVGDRTINEGVQVVFDDSSVAQASSVPAEYLTASYASNGSGNVSLQIPDSMVVVDSVVPAGDAGAGQYSVKLTNYCTTAPFPCATARAFPTAGTYHFHSATTGATGIITVLAP